MKQLIKWEEAAMFLLDRAMGYGLKYFSGFRDTHLGKIGRERKRAEI